MLNLQSFIDDPDFLVILTVTGKSDWALFGFYCMELEDLEDAILFRAADLLRCPCVDSDLSTCRARVMHRDGSEWVFKYCPDEIGFKMTDE